MADRDLAAPPVRCTVVDPRLADRTGKPDPLSRLDSERLRPTRRSKGRPSVASHQRPLVIVLRENILKQKALVRLLRQTDPSIVWAVRKLSNPQVQFLARLQGFGVTYR